MLEISGETNLNVSTSSMSDTVNVPTFSFELLIKVNLFPTSRSWKVVVLSLTLPTSLFCLF